MKKNVKIAIALVVLMILTGVYAITDKASPLYDVKVDSEDYIAQRVDEGGSVSQEFVMKEDHLDGMELKLAASGALEQIQLLCEVTNEGGSVVASEETTLEELKSGRFFDVAFSRLGNTEGKTYTFTMTVLSCSEGSEVVAYETAEGDLIVRTVTHKFDLETFVVTLCFLAYVILFMRWLSKLFK